MRSNLHLIDLSNYPKEPLSASQILSRISALMLMEGLESILNQSPLVIRFLNKEGTGERYHLAMTGISYEDSLSLREGRAVMEVVSPPAVNMEPLWLVGDGNEDEQFLDKDSGTIIQPETVAWIRFTKDPAQFKTFHSKEDVEFFLRHSTFKYGVHPVKFQPTSLRKEFFHTEKPVV